MARLGGKNIVYLAMTILVLIAFYCLASGVTTDSIKWFLRLSGRFAMGLFFISFGASALQSIFKASWSRYLVKNRRYLGISTAAVLWVHLSAIVSLGLLNPGWFSKQPLFIIVIPAAFVFVLVGLMGITSNNSAQKMLGMTRWKLLHAVGGYAALGAFFWEYIIIIFLYPAYLTTMFHPGLAYALILVPLLLIFLRIYKKINASNRKVSSASSAMVESR